MRSRSKIAYRFPKTPTDPDGHVEGFASEVDEVLVPIAELHVKSMNQAVGKLHRKLEMLGLPFDRSRLLDNPRQTTDTLSYAEQQSVQEDWEISVKSTLC